MPFMFDLAVSHAIQQASADWLNQFMHLVSLVFEPTFLAGMCLLVTVVLYHRKRRDLAAKLIVISAGNILTPFLKGVFARPRPDAALVHVLVHESGYSFPQWSRPGHCALHGVIDYPLPQTQTLVARIGRHCFNYSRRLLAPRPWRALALRRALRLRRCESVDMAMVRFIWSHIHQWLTVPHSQHKSRL